MGASRPRVVLFDLGGVLIEVPGAAALTTLAGLDSEEVAWRRWLDCRWAARFERGQCTDEQFAAGFVADWRLPLSAADFLRSYRSWVNEPLPGAKELVDLTAETTRVAALSNLNVLHWEYMQAWDLLTAFGPDVFLSFQLGLVKPDHAVFARVASELGCEPSEILFLDDNELNVDAALACGFRARKVRGVAEARRALVEDGVLP